MNRLQQMASERAAFMADCARRGMDAEFLESYDGMACEVGSYIDLSVATRDEVIASVKEWQVHICDFIQAVQDGE